MPVEFTQTARRLGISSAVVVAVLLVVYALTLAAGLRSLESPQEPIGDPFFTLLETLIIVMMPAMVTLMVVVHAWAPVRFKALTLTSVAFMGMVAGVTCSLHFVILTLSRQAEFAELPFLPLLVSFKWPSVAYALDILAWDVFFALSMLSAAPAVGGSRLAVSVKTLMLASGLLALAGLSGVPAGDMGLRNIGIVGYVGVFLAVVVLLAVLFYRSTPTDQVKRERAN